MRLNANFCKSINTYVAPSAHLTGTRLLAISLLFINFWMQLLLLLSYVRCINYSVYILNACTSDDHRFYSENHQYIAGFFPFRIVVVIFSGLFFCVHTIDTQTVLVCLCLSSACFASFAVDIRFVHLLFVEIGLRYIYIYSNGIYSLRLCGPIYRN